jgi:prepilin-type N-terminal cleavage/methylation domain-containing protein
VVDIESVLGCLRVRAGCRPRTGAAPAEAGFTLVEAVVALALFGLVAAGTALVAVRAVDGTGRTDRAVAANMLANQALEQARTLSAQAATDGANALTTGRTPALVDAVPVTDLDLTDTQIAYGAPTAAPALPVQSSETVDGTTYAVRVVVGTCQRDLTGGPCDLAAGHSAPVTLYRLIAAVTWPGCIQGQCPVTATTLLDPGRDPAFNALQDVLPVAHDKCWWTAPGTALTFDPTYQSYSLRDSGDLGNAPVRIMTSPDQGTLTQNVGSATWRYTPASGIYTTQFTYRLVDRYDRLSDPAVITLHVGGPGC